MEIFKLQHPSSFPRRRVTFSIPRAFRRLNRDLSVEDYELLMEKFSGDQNQLNKVLTLKFIHPQDVPSTAIRLRLGVEFLAMLHESLTFPLTSACWTAALLVEDISTMTYLKENKVPFSFAQVEQIANFNGRFSPLALLQWSAFHVLPSAMDTAVQRGDLAYVRVLHDNCNIPYSPMTMRYAAKNGNPALIRYLHDTGCRWDARVAAMFAHNNRLDCLTFASENGCPLNTSTCRAAAIRGHLSCLKYARSRGCRWDETVSAAAATNGHLNCLKFLYENGCPWNENTTWRALLGNHIDCLKYAYMNGCPAHPQALRVLVLNGHLDAGWLRSLVKN